MASNSRALGLGLVLARSQKGRPGLQKTGGSQCPHYAAGTLPSSHTVALPQSSPSISTSPGCNGCNVMDSSITRWLLHHSLQFPLPPLLVSLVQSKAAGCCLALALMGKLDPRGLVSRQIQSPGRTMSFIQEISEWPL